MTPIERVLAQLPDAQKTKEGWKARCKAHDDNNPSLSIATADDGRVLLHCHAGCRVEAVCDSLGLRMIDLMPTGDTIAKPSGKKSSADSKRKIVATYDYRDESGELVFQVVRSEPKTFRQRRPKKGGGWTWSVKGLPAIPYRLPELLNTSKQFVAVVEGERDSDRLNQLNILATCNAGGAGKWTAEHAKYLKEKNVVVFADNDKPGCDHAKQVALSLVDVAKAVRIVELPDLPEK
ncbi:MAG: hypothetical protein NXI22_14265, partial [bacterium]|nr:hypothetical protein [bacterium]